MPAGLAVEAFRTSLLTFFVSIPQPAGCVAQT
jgi:hypothetical protein